MAISKELQSKLDIYEQIYYSLDKPVPFKDELKIYPVLVEDYYEFYSCLPCLTMDKTMKLMTDKDGNVIFDDFGKPKKTADIEGLQQNYLTYLIRKMKEPGTGEQLTAQFMRLLELVFHMEKGMFCPKCGKVTSYSSLFEGIEDYVKENVEKVKEDFINTLRDQAKSEGINDFDESQFQIPDKLLKQMEQKARIEYIQKKTICEDCGEQMRDLFSIKSDNGKSTLMIKNVEITPVEFDEFKAIVPRQNIIDYDGDKYMDPDLKEELELKSHLQNQDYTSPTLEKQILCVAIGTGYKMEYLYKMPMRKLSRLLRLIDRKETYYSQMQAAMSGMVEFKQDPPHWIFSDDKPNIAKELTDLDNFEKKFADVT